MSEDIKGFKTPVYNFKTPVYIDDLEFSELVFERDQLRAENAKLRAALEQIVKWDDYAHTAKIARAALNEQEP